MEGAVGYGGRAVASVQHLCCSAGFSSSSPFFSGWGGRGDVALLMELCQHPRRHRCRRFSFKGKVWMTRAGRHSHDWLGSHGFRPNENLCSLQKRQRFVISLLLFQSLSPAWFTVLRRCDATQSSQSYVRSPMCAFKNKPDSASWLVRSRRYAEKKFAALTGSPP